LEIDVTCIKQLGDCLQCAADDSLHSESVLSKLDSSREAIFRTEVLGTHAFDILGWDGVGVGGCCFRVSGVGIARSTCPEVVKR
jgi:hypothetical protein